MTENKNGTITLPLPLVVTLCVLCISLSGWINAEVHNYRLRNISERLAAHEDSIIDIRRTQAESSVDRARNAQSITQISADIDEIKSDVKELLRMRNDES